MKFLIISFALLFAVSTNAQTVEYSSGSINYEDENISTIEVTLSPKVSVIKDKFSDWMNDHYDVNLDGKKLLFFNKEFMTAEGVIIPQISNRKIDLKVKVLDADSENSKLHVFASYGYNNWITEENHPYAFTALQEIVYDFVSEYLPEYYYERIVDTENRIDNIKDDNNDIADDLTNNKEEIEKLMKENDDLRKALEVNKSKLKKASKNLTVRKTEYEVVKKKVTKTK